MRGPVVGAANGVADREHAHAIGAGLEPAPGVGSDPQHHRLVDRHRPTVDHERSRPGERHVDLLHPVAGVIVLRVIVETGRQVKQLHAERFDPELRGGELHRAAVHRRHPGDLDPTIDAHHA